MNKRSLKDLLYEQVARIGKAVSSPKRLELLELLAQGDAALIESQDSLELRKGSDAEVLVFDLAA